MTRPLIGLLALATIGVGCSGTGEDGTYLSEAPVRCGISAAMDFRQPEAIRDKPPACALPTGKEVALACAVHDQVTSPNYHSPPYDEEGIPINAPPLPEYRVTDLRCRFTRRERNLAVCGFKLSTPDTAGHRADLVVTFEHLFWQDHGPAHHLYGTRWSATDRCMPVAP